MPSVSVLVRVSRRLSVTMFPFVVTVHSVNTRETLPFSFVVTDDSDDFDETSLFSLTAAAEMPTTAVSARSAPAAAAFFMSFIFAFLSLLPRSSRERTFLSRLNARIVACGC